MRLQKIKLIGAAIAIILPLILSGNYKNSGLLLNLSPTKSNFAKKNNASHLAQLKVIQLEKTIAFLPPPPPEYRPLKPEPDFVSFTSNEPIELVPVEITVLKDLRECSCHPNYQPLIALEISLPVEEESYSLFPEPVYIDPTIFEAIIYPNPTLGQTTLALDIEIENQFEISVYNLNGQLVKTVYTGLLIAGRQQFEIDLFDLETGLYFVQVLSVSQQETLKIQKV